MIRPGSAGGDKVEIPLDAADLALLRTALGGVEMSAPMPARTRCHLRNLRIRGFLSLGETRGRRLLTLSPRGWRALQARSGL